MEYGICNISMIPVRKEPSGRSEMTTQIIFGESYEIIERTKEWYRIILAYDSYEGWISGKQHYPIHASTFKALNKFPVNTTSEIISEIINETENQIYLIPFGSSLPNLEGNILRIGDQKYIVRGNISRENRKISRESIVETARLYINSPYLWGGRSPFGIDCSGFTQMVFKICGIKLLRDTSQQSEQGENISFISEAQAGDLAFFDNDEGLITHVGIILDNSKIIHASGKVRIDNIDHYGIFNKDLKKYVYKLRLIKRYL